MLLSYDPDKVNKIFIYIKLYIRKQSYNKILKKSIIKFNNIIFYKNLLLIP